MGLIWLKSPVTWHSPRVPSGYDYSKMTAEQALLIRERWHDWYTSDWDYAFTTIEFLSAGIIFMTLLHCLSLYRSRKVAQRDSTTARTPGVCDRLTAAYRYATTGQLQLKRLNYYSPPTGSIIAVAGIFVFVMALALSVRPYYWPNIKMGHSPPLATRSGWISMAIMPFMIAFATKVNFIGIITGSSHERLQVFHRWTALFMYITSLLHTFPFIVNNMRMGEMASDWKTSSFYWSGVAALVPQTYLIFMSWGIVRNRYYETFKKLHFIASGIFMSALFIHVNFRLTSWDYFWATLAIYGSAWIIQVVRTLWTSALGLPYTIEQLDDPDMVKVTVDAPARFKWSAGQHVFLRFLTAPGLHSLSTHPFTIANVPEETKGRHNVEIVIRVRGGLTKVLQGMAAKKPQGRVLLDGPYGGLPTSFERFDRVYLLAGGSGATFTLPLLMDLARRFDSIRCRHVEFILAVRHTDSSHWTAPALAQASDLAAAAGATFTVQTFVTGDGPNDVESGKVHDGDINSDDGSVHVGRPDLRAVVTAACTTGERGARIAFAACGPESFVCDVRNAVAQCELDIADGFGRCKEVYLHAESYQW